MRTSNNDSKDLTVNQEAFLVTRDCKEQVPALCSTLRIQDRKCLAAGLAFVTVEKEGVLGRRPREIREPIVSSEQGQN